MVWAWSKKTFGVCGNFKFAFIDLTDIKATRSIVKPEGFNSIKFASSTNTSNNTDVLLTKKCSWTATCNADTEFKIDTAGEVFDPQLDGLEVANITDTASEVGGSEVHLIGKVGYDKTNADQVYVEGGAVTVPTSPGKDQHGTQAYDLCPDGNEEITIYSERAWEIISANAGDEGTIFIMGD